MSSVETKCKSRSLNVKDYAQCLNSILCAVCSPPGDQSARLPAYLIKRPQNPGLINLLIAINALTLL